jgi:hypothetical protein
MCLAIPSPANDILRITRNSLAKIILYLVGVFCSYCLFSAYFNLIKMK